MSETKEMVISEARPVTPMDLIQTANESGASIEKMEQLFQLQLRWEENEAKKAYHRAVAAFKSETINIVKERKVGYTNKDGSFTGYTHATLGNIVQTIIPVMGRHGLSHSWNVEQKGADITVTCRLAHELGHSTEVTISAGKDDSGKKNAIQQVASTITYLERYTLLAITGLATQDQDDDAENAIGRAKQSAPEKNITDSQIADLTALMEQVGSDAGKFCAYFKINRIAELHASEYGRAVAMLEKKRSAA